MSSKLRARILKRIDKLRDKRFFYLISAIVILTTGIGLFLFCALCQGLGAPDPFQGIGLALLGLFISFLIASMLLFLYYSLDPYEKEPISLVMLALGLGIIVAPLIATFLSSVLVALIYLVFQIDSTHLSVINVVGIAPFVEELTKAACVGIIVLIAWEDVNSPLDGFLYGAIVGLGFSTSENILYILQGLKEGPQGFWEMVVIRWTLLLFFHQLTTAYVGTALAISKTKRNFLEKLLYIIGSLFIAMLIHFIWNSLGVMLPIRESLQDRESFKLVTSLIGYAIVYILAGFPLAIGLYRYIKLEEKNILLTLRELFKKLKLPNVLAIAVVNPTYRRKLLNILPNEKRPLLKSLLRELAFLALLLKEQTLNPTDGREELISELLQEVQEKVDVLREFLLRDGEETNISPEVKPNNI